MSPKRPATRQATRARVRRAAKPRVPVVGIVIAVVVVLGVVAIIASRGSDTTKSAKGLHETRPVSVSGKTLPTSPTSGADPAVGMTAPELHGKTFAGKPIDITNDGKPKLIIFAAHWCPHCQKEMPLLAGEFKTNGLPQGVDLYTVATGTAPGQDNYPPSTWLQDVGWTVPTLADDKTSPPGGAGPAGRVYGLPGYPYYVAIDAKGKVVARRSGEISIEGFDQLVAKARGG